MKVSICLTTYNHEKYIVQAIESVLCQITDFDFELLIGEDDSTDNTRKIVRDFKQKNPGKIKLFLNDRKNVVYINGRATGRWNIVNLIKNAEGDYISLIEGDDYWISPYKLKKQVDFMSAHPECVLCGHNTYELIEGNITDAHLTFPSGRRKINGLEDILYSNFLPTCSVMFKNHLLADFPKWYFETLMGDWPLYVMISQYGKIGYIDEPLGVYRKHDNSFWNPLSLHDKYAATIQAYKFMLENINFNTKYSQMIKSRISDHYKLMSELDGVNNDKINMIINKIRQYYYTYI